MTTPNLDSASNNKPRRRFRWLLWVLLFLVVLIVGALAAFTIYLPTLLPPLIREHGTRILGVEVSLDKVSLGFLLGRASVENLKVAAPEGFELDPIVSIGDMGVQVALGDLPSRLRLSKFHLKEASFQVERDANGRLNVLSIPLIEKALTATADEVEPEAEPAPAGEAAESMPIRIDRIDITDARLLYLDHESRPNESLRIGLLVESAEIHDVTLPADETGKMDANIVLALGQEGNPGGTVTVEATGQPLAGTDAATLDATVALDEVSSTAIGDFVNLFPVVVTSGMVNGTVTAKLNKRQVELHAVISFKNVKARMRDAGSSLGATAAEAPLVATLAMLQTAFAEIPVDVTVSGSLDDPDFHPVRNLIMSIGAALQARAFDLKGAGLLVITSLTESGEVMVQEISAEALAQGTRLMGAASGAAGELAGSAAAAATAGAEKASEMLGAGATSITDAVGVGSEGAGAAVREGGKQLEAATDAAGAAVSDMAGQASDAVSGSLDRLGGSFGIGAKATPTPAP